jgi:lipoate-protein ligase A
MNAATGAIAVHAASVQQEIDWIDRALREPVVQPAVRVWHYAAPEVVLGSSGNANGAMRERADAAGVHLSKRQTGGGAVLAGPWLLGTSAILPAQHPFAVTGIAQSYRWIGCAHASWLQSIGIAARAVAAAQPPRAPALPWACFASLSHWEVEAGGGKIVGLAQCRRRTGTVFSSAVLVGATPWELLCRVLGEPLADAPALAARTASCAQLLARPQPPETLARSLLLTLAGELGLPYPSGHIEKNMIVNSSVSRTL